MFKRVILSLCLALSLVTVSCSQKEQTVADKYLETQSNPETYGKPQKFTLDAKFDINLDTKLPENPYAKTVEEAMKLGDEYCVQLNAFRQSRERREEIMRAYEEVTDQLVPIAYVEKTKPIATYKIDGDDIILETGKLDKYQEAVAVDVFEHYTKLIPKEWRKNIVEYNIENETEIPFGAYITYSKNNPNKLVIGVNLAMVRYIDKYTLNYMLIHEFGHAFSIDERERTKPETDDDEYLSVFREDSYLKTFNKTFWKNVPEFWQLNNKKKQEDVNEFCRINRENFVTPYAVSNVYEDFAESFSYFVLEENTLSSSRPMDIKTNFFYQYPELVLLRLQLLKAVNELR